jgi:Ca2+-binding EF-hand superfamily protein
LQTATANLQTQGLTKEQITTLCSSMSGTNSYSTVLEYFDQIDTNNDGKVTDAEIKAFQYKAQRQKLDTQMNAVKSSNYSVYYANETESEPSSVLDSFYPDV